VLVPTLFKSFSVVGSHLVQMIFGVGSNLVQMIFSVGSNLVQMIFSVDFYGWKQDKKNLKR
jgi:ATP-dependent 26S proteasome regulatory subunit